jgi:hypothetical protein
MSGAPPTKREIERRLAACKASGMDVAGVRFGADGSMTILTTSGERNREDEAERLERRMREAFNGIDPAS